MDNKTEILLGSQKNINSVNVNNYNTIELTNNTAELTEFTVNDVISATKVFDTEREANQIYRIYGKIEYLSLLNGLINNYKVLSDFFNPVYTGNSKNIVNSFDFYLVRPAISGYTEIDGDVGYVRYFEVIATPDDFEIFPAGFSNNVYGEQSYAFSFKKDFDVSTYLDDFGFPATELFLYAQYNLKQNGYNVWETMKYTNWSNITGIASQSSFQSKSLNIGDFVETATGAKIGDLISYDKKEFTQTQLTPQTVYISTNLNGANQYLIWKYNPFIPFRLRYFSGELNSANSGNTSYDIINSIPDYATPLDNDGNYVWREISPQGYIDPLTGLGVDYPFMNKRRYLFSNIILSVSPDLNDGDTAIVFDEIYFSDNPISINETPITELDDIEKPCQ